MIAYVVIKDSDLLVRSWRNETVVSKIVSIVSAIEMRGSAVCRGN